MLRESFHDAGGRSPPPRGRRCCNSLVEPGVKCVRAGRWSEDQVAYDDGGGGGGRMVSRPARLAPSRHAPRASGRSPQKGRKASAESAKKAGRCFLRQSALFKVAVQRFKEADVYFPSLCGCKKNKTKQNRKAVQTVKLSSPLNVLFWEPEHVFILFFS